MVYDSERGIYYSKSSRLPFSGDIPLESSKLIQIESQDQYELEI